MALALKHLELQWIFCRHRHQQIDRMDSKEQPPSRSARALQRYCSMICIILSILVFSNISVKHVCMNQRTSENSVLTCFLYLKGLSIPISVMWLKKKKKNYLKRQSVQDSREERKQTIRHHHIPFLHRKEYLYGQNVLVLSPEPCMSHAERSICIQQRYLQSAC